jgi:hypothetical protein
MPVEMAMWNRGQGHQLRRLSAEDSLKRADEFQAVRVEARVPYVTAVTATECFYRVGQIDHPWHASAINEYWYDADVAAERCFNF